MNVKDIEDWLEDQGWEYNAKTGKWEIEVLNEEENPIVVYCTAKQAEEYRTKGPTQGLH